MIDTELIITAIDLLMDGLVAIAMINGIAKVLAAILD